MPNDWIVVLEAAVDGSQSVGTADVEHHFPDRPAYLRRLVRALNPGGRLAAVDWHKRATPIGPPWPL